MADTADRLLSGRDLSDMIGVPERTLDQWRYIGKGPAWLKIGRHVRYRRADVEQWLDTRVGDPKSVA